MEHLSLTCTENYTCDVKIILCNSANATRIQKGKTEMGSHEENVPGSSHLVKNVWEL